MDITPAMSANAAVCRAAAAGSMVLLKNTNNALPFEKNEDGSPLPIAVFGLGQLRTVNTDRLMQPWRSSCILDALCASDAVQPDALLSHKYRAFALASPNAEQMPSDSLSFEEFAQENAAAVIVISRSTDCVRARITDEERTLIARVCANFSRSVLVLNTPREIDLLDCAQDVSAIVFMGIAGQEGPAALVDLLTGCVVPSGRLAFTWPLSADDASDAESLSPFVGYRLYDTFGKDVRWPFGYGLDYGTAELQSVSVGLDGCDITVQAEVCNISERFAVRQTVQVYVSAPASSAVYELRCFGKTRLLAPGERQTLHLRFAIGDCAVFREDASAYVLESGYYDVRVGTNSRATYLAGSVRLTRSAIVQAVAPMHMGESAEAVRAGTAYTYPEEAEELASARVRAIRFSDRNLPRVAKKKGRAFTGCRSDGQMHTLQDVKDGLCSVFTLVASMDDESLRRFVTEFTSCASDIPGALGASPSLPQYGIGAYSVAEGAYGVQLEKQTKNEDGEVISTRTCTAFAAPSLLACSFDSDLIRAVGKAIGRELRDCGISFWLAPATDLIASPVCWSEDPLVSGLCAIAVADGVRPFAAPVLRSVRTENADISQAACRDLHARAFAIAASAYPAALIPAIRVCGEVPGEDSDLLRSLSLDWHFGGAFLADDLRYGGEPDRITLERSAIKLLNLLAKL